LKVGDDREPMSAESLKASQGGLAFISGEHHGWFFDQISWSILVSLAMEADSLMSSIRHCNLSSNHRKTING
jgi:hypothetical protein